MVRRRRRDNEEAAPGIGQILRAARGAMGISLERAASDTDLRASYLGALERDDIESLGLDPAYIRGTLRSYADYLGLDSSALVARHRAGDGSGPDVRAVEDEDPTDHSSLPFRAARVVVGVVVLAVVAVLAFMLGQALAQGSLLPTIAGWFGTVSDQASARWPLPSP